MRSYAHLLNYLLSWIHTRILFVLSSKKEPDPSRIVRHLSFHAQSKMLQIIVTERVPLLLYL